MLKKIMADISEIKTDVKGNNNKIDDLTSKVGSLETKQKETEEINSNAIKEIKENFADVETNVTSKLMKEIQPTLGQMKNEIQDNVNLNMRRLIQEEMALQKHVATKNSGEERNVTVPSEESSCESDDAGEKGEPAKKNKKSKKKIKKEKPKQIQMKERTWVK